MPFARRCDPGGAQPEVEGAGKAMEDEGAGVGRLARDIVVVTFSSRFNRDVPRDVARNASLSRFFLGVSKVGPPELARCASLRSH